MIFRVLSTIFIFTMLVAVLFLTMSGVAEERAIYYLEKAHIDKQAKKYPEQLS